jgi:hypothetical protein
VSGGARGLAVALIGLAALLAYLPSFAVPFQFDDYARIGDNQALHDGRLLDAVNMLGNTRVLPSLTLIANYRASGLEPFAYHLVNFCIHVGAALGVFALALALCRTPRLRAAWPPRRALTLATVAALLFALHPLQTQAVTYIVQRHASMAALFYVWAVVCYVRARSRQRGGEPGRAGPFIAAAALCGVAALLSKENAASLPLALFVTEWLFFGRPPPRAIAAGAAVAVAAVAVLVVWKALAWNPLRPDGTPVYTFAQRLVTGLQPPGTGPRPAMADYLRTQATVVPRYLLLVVRPWGLNVDHDVPLARALSAPVLGGLALLGALAVLAVTQARRRPLLAYAILWLFVTLSIESSVVPIADVMVEHRMYLPLAGLALAGGGLFAAAAARAPRAAFAAGGALAGALVALTFARNLIWLSPVTLWIDAADKAPAKARPHLNAGVAYHQRDQLDAAVARYCRALALAPDDVLARENLEIALEDLGRLDAVAVHAVRPGRDGALTIEIEELDPAAHCP